MEHKIYLIKQDGIPCYVGMTKMTLQTRFYCHCNDKRKTMYEPIKKHGKEHFEIIKIDHAHDKEEAFYKEEFWTLFYKGRFVLYNNDIGKHRGNVARKKISDATTGERQPMFGKHHTEESKRKMSDAKKKYPVQCIETETIYTSLKEAQRQTNIYCGNIRRACIKNMCAGGFHWRYVNAA